MSPLVMLVLFCVNTISANHLKKITAITGSVKLMEMDSDLNIYIVAQDSNKETFYKINSEHEIVLEYPKSYSQNVKIFVTQLKYVWMVSDNSIYLLKPNSTLPEYLESYSLSSEKRKISTIDRNGNLIYNTNYGWSIFKIEATTSVLIVNLENVEIENETGLLVDRSNNIYLAGFIREYNDEGQTFFHRKVALITSDELKNLAPSAQIIDGPDRFLFLNSYGIVTQFYRHIIVAYNGDHARLYTIEKKSSSLHLKVLYSRPFSTYYKFHWVKDYFYYFGQNNGGCYLNFAYMINDPNLADTWSFDIKRIGYSEFERELCESGQMLSDTDGNLFLTSNKKLYKLKADENRFVGIDPLNELIKHNNKHKPISSTNKIFSMDLDEEDNLWILGKGELYFLRKNSTKADPMTNSSLAVYGGILKINKKTKEIIIGSDEGLYVYSK